MSRNIRRHRNVRRDLADIFVYLGQTRVASAHRFLRETEATFQRLAEFPGMGVRYESDDPLFEGIRVFPVARFKKDLVFDRPIEGGIEVLHVLHGARDIPGLLAEGLDIPDEEHDQPDEAPARRESGPSSRLRSARLRPSPCPGWRRPPRPSRPPRGRRGSSA